MKVRPSVKPMCDKCKVIKRKGRVMVICKDPNRAEALHIIEGAGSFTGKERFKVWQESLVWICPRKSVLKSA